MGSPRKLMLDKLRESGLDGSDAKKLNLQPYTTEASKALKLSRSGEGFKIPYPNNNGMFRYRFFNTVSTEGFTAGAKLRKYDQPQNTPVEIYLPQLGGVDWDEYSKDTTKPLIITEGELKAACATKNKIPTIGLGGVYSFGRGNKDLRLHKTLDAFEWQGRDVYICYDSDAAINDHVMLAENGLAKALLDVGAVVHVVRIPPDGDAKKMGLDDFIVKNGIEAFRELQNSTPVWETCQQLHELNAQYAVCRDTAAICEKATRRMYSKEKFLLLEAPRTMKERVPPGETRKPKIISAAKEWIEWPKRSEVDGVTYEPGAPTLVNGRLNQWTDPSIEPREGDTTPFDRLTEHLVTNAADRTWLLQWAAYPLQHRGKRNNVAVLMWSRAQGQGKSLWGETTGLLHGRENYTEIQQQQLESDFNEWQPRRTFIMGSELCGPSARDARAFGDQLKSFITASKIKVNEKYEKSYDLPNTDNYYLTSNHLTALHLDEHARRFFVVRATEAKLPQEFYTRFVEWRDNGGLSALLYKMLHVDLTGFDPGADAPRTKDMMEMIANDRSDLQDFCHELHEDSQAVLARHNWSAIIAENRFATTEQLMRAYLERTPNARINRKQLTLELTEAGFAQANEGGQIRVGNRRERFWIIRDFENAAKLTQKKIGDEWQSGSALKATKKHAAKGEMSK
jgi:hypothetical protein